MNIRKTMYAAVGAFALTAMSACSSQSPMAQQTEQQMAAKDQPVLVETATIKQGADVSFSHNYDGTTDPGFVESFQIFIQEGYEVGTLDIIMNASEGLTLSADSQTNFSMAGDGVRTLNISVSAQTPNKYYVNLQARADDGSGQAMLRSYGVAIYVGDPKLYPKVEQKFTVEDTKDGGKIIVLEAEETIEK